MYQRPGLPSTDFVQFFTIPLIRAAAKGEGALHCSKYLSSLPVVNTPSETRELELAFARARAIHKHHGKSYYFAARMFPRELQQATFALYAFFRVPDEIVDNSPLETPSDLQAVKDELNQWGEQWRAAYQSGRSEHPVLHVTAHTFHRYQIPYDYSEAFLAAMIQDTYQARYATYADLEGYMYGSAAVVGLMMSHVIGFQNPALEHAEKLGYAMQLTNFLRDVDEDYQLRGRVYLPQDELAQFGVTDEQISARQFDDNFRALAQFQAQRAHRLYDEANQGIALLQPEGRMAVACASVLYRAILGKLAAQDWNVFARRAKTGLGEKMGLAARTYRRHRRGNYVLN